MNELNHTKRGRSRTKNIPGMESVHNRILFIRTQFDLTQAGFAQKIGISKGYASDIETGKKNPSQRVLDVICAHFGEVNKDWLVTGRGEWQQSHKKTDTNKETLLPPAAMMHFFSALPEKQVQWLTYEDVVNQIGILFAQVTEVRDYVMQQKKDKGELTKRENAKQT